MKPAEGEIPCSICQRTFTNRRDLKNHLAAAPHRMLTVLCVWCPTERIFRRMVDLKDHILQHHRLKMELMPRNFLTENNGFWISYHPSVYQEVIMPTPADSTEAMKARIEVLSAVSRWKKPSRSIAQWEEGWKATATGSAHQAQKRGYSPSRPSMLEYLDIDYLSIGLGATLEYLKLEVGDVTIWFKAEMTDSILRDKRAMDSLLRRITLLPTPSQCRPENHRFKNIKYDTEKPAIATKLGIGEKFIKVIYRAESEFWKVPRLADLPDSTPFIPVGSPSTNTTCLQS